VKAAWNGSTLPSGSSLVGPVQAVAIRVSQKGEGGASVGPKEHTAASEEDRARASQRLRAVPLFVRPHPSCGGATLAGRPTGQIGL
jgi:hypothetical protein